MDVLGEHRKLLSVGTCCVAGHPGLQCTSLNQKQPYDVLHRTLCRLQRFDLCDFPRRLRRRAEIDRWCRAFSAHQSVGWWLLLQWYRHADALKGLKWMLQGGDCYAAGFSSKLWFVRCIGSWTDGASTALCCENVSDGLVRLSVWLTDGPVSQTATCVRTGAKLLDLLVALAVGKAVCCTVSRPRRLALLNPLVFKPHRRESKTNRSSDRFL